jgi:hypothetical protein
MFTGMGTLLSGNTKPNDWSKKKNEHELRAGQ